MTVSKKRNRNISSFIGFGVKIPSDANRSLVPGGSKETLALIDRIVFRGYHYLHLHLRAEGVRLNLKYLMRKIMSAKLKKRRIVCNDHN